MYISSYPSFPAVSPFGLPFCLHPSGIHDRVGPQTIAKLVQTTPTMVYGIYIYMYIHISLYLYIYMCIIIYIYECLELVTVTCSVYKPTSLGDRGASPFRGPSRRARVPALPSSSGTEHRTGCPGLARPCRGKTRLLIGGRDLGREILAKLRNRMINVWCCF